MRRVAMFAAGIHVCASVAAAAPPDSAVVAPADSAAALSDSAAAVNPYRTIITAYPFLFYTPETELAIGGGGIMTFYPGEEGDDAPPASKLTGSAYYATAGTYSFSALTEMQLWHGYVLTASAAFSNGVTKYFGTGPNSSEEGNEEYDHQPAKLWGELQIPRLVPFSDRIGVILRLEDMQIVDRKQNPHLYDSTLVGQNGGRLVGVGLSWLWDDRDSIFWPTKGMYHQARMVFQMETIGSDYTYNELEVDLRKYFTLAPKRVLAAQVYVASSEGGAVPFYKLPALGGQNRMRGYYSGRYRDDFYWTSQAEYRQYVGHRLGFVVFAGAGGVGENIGSIRLDTVRVSWGGGLRFLFNQKENVNVRADIGFGRDTSGVYFGIEEAF